MHLQTSHIQSQKRPLIPTLYVLQEEEEVRRENQWWVKLYSMRAFLCLLCLAIRRKMFEHSTNDCNVWDVQGVRVMGGGGPRRKWKWTWLVFLPAECCAPVQTLPPAAWFV